MKKMSLSENENKNENENKIKRTINQKIIRLFGPSYYVIFKYNPYLYYYNKFESAIVDNNMQRIQIYIPYILEIDLTHCLSFCIQNFKKYHENKEIMDLLIAYGANVDGIIKHKRVCYTLADAINIHKVYGSYPLKCLLKNGADVNLCLMTNELFPLIHTMNQLYFYGDSYYECIELLIKYGTDVNKIGCNIYCNRDHICCMSPLFIMCKHDSKKRYSNKIRDMVFDLLIKNGADVNWVDNIGRTPLMIASLRDNEDVVQILVKNGANVNIQDIKGCTALMHSLQLNNDCKYQLCSFLIESGANIHTKNYDDETAFFYAIKNSSLCTKLGPYLTEWQLLFYLFVKNGTDVYNDTYNIYPKLPIQKQELITNYIGILELKKFLHDHVLQIIINYLSDSHNEIRLIKYLFNIPVN